MGSEEEYRPKIVKSRRGIKLSGNEGWVLGFWVSLLAVILPVLFAAMAGINLVSAIKDLVRSSSISLLCVATAISILVSYFWQEKFMRDRDRLLIFIFASDMIYGFVAYAEYAKIPVNDSLLIPINVIIAFVMLFIMYNVVYKLRG